jgi:hypothetical protein
VLGLKSCSFASSFRSMRADAWTVLLARQGKDACRSPHAWLRLDEQRAEAICSATPLSSREDRRLCVPASRRVCPSLSDGRRPNALHRRRMKLTMAARLRAIRRGNQYCDAIDVRRRPRLGLTSPLGVGLSCDAGSVGDARKRQEEYPRCYDGRFAARDKHWRYRSLTRLANQAVVSLRVIFALCRRICGTTARGSERMPDSVASSNTRL